MSHWASFVADLLDQLPLILTGLYQTLLLAAIVSVTGLALGIVVLHLEGSHRRLVRVIVRGYISFFVGTPLLVLLFLMYYGLPRIGLVMTPFAVALIGFTLNVAAYNAAYLGTARNALDPAELEAARAQGFSERQVFFLIMLPQVLRMSIPALTNQVILNLKDTSIAFLIQYTEFFARMQELAATNFQFFKAYAVTAAVYLALVSIIVLVARVVEKRFLLPGSYTPS
jgi:polar amino acid transport system permease protein